MVFIGVAGQDIEDEMAGFVREHGVEDIDHIADVGGQLWSAFGVTAQPTFIFINDNGDINQRVGLTADALATEVAALTAS